MTKGKNVKVTDLNWGEFNSRMPKHGVVYPEGQEKADLITRMRKAFRKAKVNQAA